MKIKMIKFYTGVMIGDGSGTLGSFTPDDHISDAAQRKGLKAEEKVAGVLLTSKNGSALVPWNNICYIQYSPDTETAKPAKTK